MKKKNKITFLIIICIFLFGLMVLSTFQLNYLVLADQNIKLGDNKDTEITRTKEINQLDTSELICLNSFSSGSTQPRILSTPDGCILSLSLPPDVVVTEAILKMRGKFPDQVNKYPIGSRPPFISGADLDLDGNIDIITTDLESHQFFILFGRGDGNFERSVSYPTDELPNWGTLNDFNNDGYVDFATANEGGNSITVYQNMIKDDGGFKKISDYRIGDMPRSITNGDYNNDGWLDIASISSNDNKLWINLNQKGVTTSFSDALNYSIDDFPVGIISGDLNNDALFDLAIIHVGGNLTIDDERYYDTVSIYINKGDSQFLPKQDYAVGEKPAGVIMDDFNNDGWLDVATSNHAGYNVSVLLNNGKGDGTFNNAINYALIDKGKSGRNLHSGDIDGDGDSDIISICGTQNSVGILKNNGDGTFARFKDYLGGQSPSDVFLADFDNDGDLDAATSNIGTNVHEGSVSIIPNNGDGTFSTYEFYYVGGWPRAINNGDVNNDGNLDLITANYLGGSLTICYNDGAGYYDYRYNRSIAVEPFAVITDDIDGDGYIDLVSADEGLFEIVIIFNDGDGNFKKRPKVSYDIGGYPYSLLYHDFNGDGKKDLVSSNNAQKSISYLRNLGNGTFAPYVDYSFADQRPFGLATGDLDGDGDDDIICTHLGYESAPETKISIIWNDGNGNFTSHDSYEVGIDPINVRVADVDLDGDSDLIMANMGSNSTTVLLNHDNTSFGSRRDYPVGPIPMGITLEDMNGDGYLDIITANHNNNSISILYNLGDGTFDEHIEILIGALPTYITIADLNNDGTLDVATSNLLTNSISVRLDFGYPSGISIAIGDITKEHFSYPKRLTSDLNIPNFTANLNSYLTSHSSDYITTDAGPRVMIPISVNSSGVGILELFDLKVDYYYTLDTDGDDTPDAFDTDDDDDLFPDTWEIYLESDPKLSSSQPADTDDDGKPDGDTNNTMGWMDTDDDDDGYPDEVEIEEGTNPLDADDFPADEEDEIDIIVLIILMIIIIILILILTLGGRKKPELEEPERKKEDKVVKKSKKGKSESKKTKTKKNTK